MNENTQPTNTPLNDALRTLELLRNTNAGMSPSPSAEDLFLLAEDALTWALDELVSINEDEEGSE